MIRFRFILRAALFALAAVSIPVTAHAATMAPARDAVLVSNSLAAVTRADYDAELSRLPADVREGFANDPRRVHDLLNRMLMQKSLAAQARASKLDATPENAARIALEMDRLLAAMQIDAVERAARAEFDANISRYEARARELYLVNKDAYAQPPEASASHILFDTTKKYTSEDARRKAEETRARLVAGADFATLARELSDDPVSAEKGGEIGWFIEKQMDPAFAKAAFALQKPGDLSNPVRSAFGWHIIRLDGKRPAVPQPYPEAREKIMAELRQRYADEKRNVALAAIRGDPKASANSEAIDALVPKVDADALRRAQELARSLSASPAK